MSVDEVGGEGVAGEEESVGEGGPVIQGMLLRTKLVVFRKNTGMTQEDVARRLEWHPSKLIRIEGGKTSVRKTDLAALLRLYGVDSDDELERMQKINQAARAGAWWDEYKNDVGEAYLSYVGYEAGASFIRQFQPLAIPGLLQTQAYAETLLVDGTGVVQLGQLVRLRLRRQAELSRKEVPPRQFFILDEAAIRRHVGIKKDAGIMPDQLLHIVDVVEKNENINVMIVPFAAGAHPGMLRGAFTLLDLQAGLGELLHLEIGVMESTIMGNDPRIAESRVDFEDILAEALSQEDSLSLIKKVADEMG